MTPTYETMVFQVKEQAARIAALEAVLRDIAGALSEYGEPYSDGIVAHCRRIANAALAPAPAPAFTLTPRDLSGLTPNERLRALMRGEYDPNDPEPMAAPAPAQEGE